MTVKQIFEEKNAELFALANIDPNKSFDELSEDEIKRLEENYKLIANKGLSKSNDIDSLFNQIKDLIDKGELKDEEQIRNYINNLDLSEEDKNKLISNSLGYLDSKSNNNQIIAFKEKLFRYLQKERKEGTLINCTFDIKSDTVGKQLCNVKLSGTMDNVTKEFENYTFFYTDELKKELIEPVIYECVLKDTVIANDFVQSDASFGYRSDYSMVTATNSIVNVNNCEQGYAQFLKEKVTSLSRDTKIIDKDQRNARINELKEERDLDNYLENDKPLSLTRKKDGFISACCIVTIVSLITYIGTIISIIIK